jgi:Zn-dependent protease
LIGFGPDLLYIIPALLIGLTIHEFAHSWVSTRLGDPTPKQEGRLTLNPLAHVDPIGLLALWLFGFGWGRPVPINPVWYKNRRRGILLVSVAGIIANLVTAFVSLIVLYLLLVINAPQALITVVQYIYTLDLGLAAFNLIPIPPLDGSKILATLLPPPTGARFLAAVEQYGFIILIGFILFGNITGVDILGMVMDPLIGAVNSVFTYVVTNAFQLFLRF